MNPMRPNFADDEITFEYEEHRTQTLNFIKESSYRSKNGSQSPSYLQYRNRSTSPASKFDTTSKEKRQVPTFDQYEKSDKPTSGTISLFENGQETQINTMDLHRIVVKLNRNIPVTESVTEIQRDILNSEDIIIQRREGEGCKPIFDRDEIKQAIIKPVDIYIEEATRNQSRHHTDIKCQDSKTKNHDARKNDERSHTQNHREYKEKYIENDTTKHDTDRLRSRELHDSHSRYRERSCRRSYERSDRDRDRDRFRSRSRERKDKYFHEREARDRNKDRDRNRERERERDRDNNRDRSMERRDASHYIKSPISLPNICYYNNDVNLALRGLIRPFGPYLRGPIHPMERGIHPAPIWPRFVPLYRPRHPSFY